MSDARVGARMGASRAAEYLNDPVRAGRLLDSAIHKAEEKGRGALADVLDSLFALVRLVRAFVSRRYTEVPWDTMLLVAGAIIYFVMPLDLAPDFIAGLGLVDDAAVIAWVVKTVKDELDGFRAWEARTGAPRG